MPRGYNIAIVSGQANGMASQGTSPNGAAVLDLTVLTGNYHGAPVDVPVKVWGKRGADLGQIIHEGDWVDVHGELQWDRHDGMMLCVVAHDVKVFKRDTYARVQACVPQESRQDWEVG